MRAECPNRDQIDWDDELNYGCDVPTPHNHPNTSSSPLAPNYIDGNIASNNLDDIHDDSRELPRRSSRATAQPARYADEKAESHLALNADVATLEIDNARHYVPDDELVDGSHENNGNGFASQLIQDGQSEQNNEDWWMAPTDADLYGRPPLTHGRHDQTYQHSRRPQRIVGQIDYALRKRRKLSQPASFNTVIVEER